jgi:hypothetical protein
MVFEAVVEATVTDCRSYWIEDAFEKLGLRLVAESD